MAANAESQSLPLSLRAGLPKPPPEQWARTRATAATVRKQNADNTLVDQYRALRPSRRARRVGHVGSAALRPAEGELVDALGLQQEQRKVRRWRRRPAASASVSARSRGSIGAAVPSPGSRRPARRPARPASARRTARARRRSVLVHAAARARARLRVGLRRGHEGERASMRNWSRALAKYQHASPCALELSSAFAERRSVTNVSVHVSHSQPRKTTVRTRGRSSRDTVPSSGTWRSGRATRA